MRKEQKAITNKKIQHLLLSFYFCLLYQKAIVYVV